MQIQTFKQFLLEEEQDVLDLIKRDCKPFLSQAKGQLLYRGFAASMPKTTPDVNGIPFFKALVRKDRAPLSMPKKAHKIIDDYFEEMFNVKARSESLFCYPKSLESKAESYARENPNNIMCIYPIGNFKIIWSESVNDLYITLEEFTYEHDSSFEDAAMELVPDLDYVDDNVPGALESRSELMLICDEYYAVPTSKAK